ncbi:helix-turn-helix domain-containing protein [Nocardia goodfellowii]|uniref:Transcriptional regulator with XRE-family HTH domain n=1 Tax=Nocardia goodfellowii TaxID=882446 RepID=A0ABS4QEM0_9NOCA|nr:helix-turn-helix transcriptional regulator [Nocardia goodfellowii]MBP2190135.1 transcriptional regulator with XRE-family HTH domain [Nocardia goodfellowii]
MAGKRTVLTAGLRRLAALLFEMREGVGLSKEEVSGKTGINVTTLYRIEAAQARPQRRTLMTLLDLYGVEQERRKYALDLLSDAQKPGMSRPWEGNLTEVYAAYINFESEALSARHYQTSYIPGLLQTEQYAMAVIDTTMPKVEASIMESRAQARMERARVLSKDDPLELWVVLDEAAIRRVVGGPEVMHGQLQKLLQESKRKNVILQILPFNAGAHPGMAGSFTLVDFPKPEDPELVYVEGIAGDELIEGHTEIRRFGVIFDQLRAMALSPRDSSALIEDIAESMRS